MNSNIHCHDIKAENVSVTMSGEPYDQGIITIDIRGKDSYVTVNVYTDEVLGILRKFAPEFAVVR